MPTGQQIADVDVGFQFGLFVAGELAFVGAHVEFVDSGGIAFGKIEREDTLSQRRGHTGARLVKTSVLTADDPALHQMVGRLAEAYRPERIYLFGSVARGDAGPDSDYDLLVVMPDNSRPELLRSRTGCRASRDLAAPRDLLVMRSGEFERQLRLRASLASTVEREGRILYERRHTSSP